MSLFKQSLYCLYAAAMLMIVTSRNPLMGLETPSKKDTYQARISTVTLTPVDLYEWNILEEKISKEIITLSVHGTLAKRDGNLEMAIPLLEQAAQYENVGAILELADICVSQNNWLQATKWYVLGFQIHWLNTQTHQNKAKEWLERLPDQHKSIKAYLKDTEQKSFTLFVNTIKAKKRNFFSCYLPKENTKARPSIQINLSPSNGVDGFEPLRNGERLYAIIKCRELFKANTHEPYLSSRERELKEQWMFRTLVAEAYSNEKREIEGDYQFFSKKDFKKAAYCFNGINTPNSLEQLGFIFESSVDLKRQQITKFLLLKTMNFPETAFGVCITFYCRINQLSPNFSKAADYYQRAQTSRSYERLGGLYEKGRLGAVDLENPAKYYELSNTPDSLYSAGLLYERTGNYQEAARMYERSQTSRSYGRLGGLYEKGHLGAVDLGNAAKCYELSNTPLFLYFAGLLYERTGNYQEAARMYERSQTSQGNAQIGQLWQFGKLGESNDQKAASYYLRSEEPLALQNLMHLCVNNQLNKETCQTALYSLRKFQHPYKNLMLIHLYKRKEFCHKIGLADPDARIAILTKELYKNLVALQPSQQAFIKGILESFEDHFDSALLHLSEALALGENHAESYLNYVTELKNAQEKLDFEGEAFPLQGNSSDSDEFVSEMNKPSIEKNKEPNKKLPQRERKSPEERKKKYQEKLARIKEKFGIIPLSPLNEIDSHHDIEFSFLNMGVQKAFNSLEKEKLKTIIDDISYKPWATEGVGKPEVLKGKYKNHKGCLSRRIDDKERLVYKVTGSKKVLILSCTGHYKK